jgi:type I restriction enzyme S subunit
MNEGGDNDKLGRGTVWQEEILPCLHQNHVFCVRPFQIKFSQWISTWTQGFWAKSYFLLRGKQTTNLASISSTSIKELPIPVLPDSEQTAIAAYLDRETATIDQLVTKVEAAIVRLLEYRTALITAAVTGKIDVRGKVDGQRPTQTGRD